MRNVEHLKRNAYRLRIKIMSTHLKTLAKKHSPNPLRVFPLGGSFVLPGCDLPLNIFEPRYLNMVDDALKSDRLIGIVQTAEAVKGAAGVEVTSDGLAKVGTLARIRQFSETDDGRYLIVLTGLKRFEIIEEPDVTTPYRQCRVDYAPFEADIDSHVQALMPKALKEDEAERARLTAAMKKFARSLGVEVDWEGLEKIPMPNLVDQAAMISPFGPVDKQSLLEAESPDKRRMILMGLMEMYGGGHSHSGRDGSGKPLQ